MVNIEVKRSRASVTQGDATVYINGEPAITFHDEMYLRQKDGTFTSWGKIIEHGQFYGEVIGGYGSIKPDSDFIVGALYHPLDNIYHHSDKIKNIIKKSSVAAV